MLGSLPASDLERYAKKNMDDDYVTVSPPLYMVGMKIGCWKCSERMTVMALLAPKVEGADNQICILSDVASLPKDVLVYIQRRVPTFQLRYSKTVQGKYYANICPSCGTLTGDFFLHSEPGAPFFPTCEEEAWSALSRRSPCAGFGTHSC